MEKHSKLPTTHCPDCGWRAGLVADFKAPQGMDPRLRAFKCLSCGSIFYKIVKRYQSEYEGTLNHS